MREIGLLLALWGAEESGDVHDSSPGLASEIANVSTLDSLNPELAYSVLTDLKWKAESTLWAKGSPTQLEAGKGQ